MKVLHYVESDSLSFRTPFVDLMKALERKGLSQVLLCGPGGDMQHEAVSKGIETLTWRPVASNVPILCPRYAAIVKSVGPDIVHTRLSAAAAMAGFWNKILKIPTIATLDKAAKAKYYRGADHFMACSAWTRDYMIHQGLCPEKIDVVYNSIDVKKYARDDLVRAKFRERLGISPNEKILISAGVFRRNKGFDFLIRAFARFVSSRGDTRLLLAGDGEERPAYSGLIESLELGGKVILSDGYVSDIRPWLWGADFFVLPSRGEPFGIILLEAMASGLPVIATDEGGPKEIITHGENGLLTPVDDVPAMVSAMKRLTDSSTSLIQRVVSRGYERLSDFTSEALAETYMTIYEKVLRLRTAR
ncbi:MAG: glycosyltransferase family 4 protein [Synergistaceae bacterium]|nr:glycosyltransferase family 4 protein [Synergistaceae bacterium]